MTEVFHIVPASSRAAWMWVPLLGLLLVVLIGTFTMVGLSMRGSRSATFELSPDGLRMRGDLYGRRVPASALRGGAARVVDLEQDRTLRPRSRTMGTAVPGYRAGWFRLNSGEKALLYLTDPHRVVYVPTRDGYSLLLSVDRPQDFVERVRSIAPAM
jgi:PH (Pleckstrin Homology) domain-containing protein